MANSVEADKMAGYEPSHLDLHCLHRYLFWCAGLKGLKKSEASNQITGFVFFTQDIRF